MRDISLQFLDMLRMREVVVAHEPMSAPKSITFQLAKFSPFLGVEENEHQFHLRELNTLANLFLAAGVAYIDCATHTSKIVVGRYVIDIQCDVYGGPNQTKSIHERLVRVLELYQFCRLFAADSCPYKAYVSTHNLYPYIEASSPTKFDLAEIRHRLIADTDAPKPVLDILIPFDAYSNLKAPLVSLQNELTTTCLKFSGAATEGYYSLIRIYLNEDYPCEGHPELFVDTAMGMYHCEVCGDMQLAGTFHLPRETGDATS